jgi:8-oxo-dGTP pyrophosphatase MutT (NUDIX family)
MSAQPNGAMVAVFSQSPEGRRYLLLHNVDYALEQTGDWAWGSPSGCLEPDEDIAACAARELFEETGIRATPVPVVTADIDWAVFFLEVPWGTRVKLSPTEHNDFAWVPIDDALAMCRPERLAASLRRATDAIQEHVAGG